MISTISTAVLNAEIHPSTYIKISEAKLELKSLADDYCLAARAAVDKSKDKSTEKSIVGFYNATQKCLQCWADPSVNFSDPSGLLEVLSLSVHIAVQSLRKDAEKSKLSPSSESKSSGLYQSEGIRGKVLPLNKEDTNSYLKQLAVDSDNVFEITFNALEVITLSLDLMKTDQLRQFVELICSSSIYDSMDEIEQTSSFTGRVSKFHASYFIAFAGMINIGMDIDSGKNWVTKCRTKAAELLEKVVASISLYNDYVRTHRSVERRLELTIVDCLGIQNLPGFCAACCDVLVCDGKFSGAAGDNKRAVVDLLLTISEEQPVVFASLFGVDKAFLNMLESSSWAEKFISTASAKAAEPKKSSGNTAGINIKIASKGDPAAKDQTADGAKDASGNLTNQIPSRRHKSEGVTGLHNARPENSILVTTLQILMVGSLKYVGSVSKDSPSGAAGTAGSLTGSLTGSFAVAGAAGAAISPLSQARYLYEENPLLLHRIYQLLMQMARNACHITLAESLAYLAKDEGKYFWDFSLCPLFDHSCSLRPIPFELVKSPVRLPVSGGGDGGGGGGAVEYESVIASASLRKAKRQEIAAALQEMELGSFKRMAHTSALELLSMERFGLLFTLSPETGKQASIVVDKIFQNELSARMSTKFHDWLLQYLMVNQLTLDAEGIGGSHEQSRSSIEHAAYVVLSQASDVQWETVVRPNSPLLRVQSTTLRGTRYVDMSLLQYCLDQLPGRCWSVKQCEAEVLLATLQHMWLTFYCQTNLVEQFGKFLEVYVSPSPLLRREKKKLAAAAAKAGTCSGSALNAAGVAAAKPLGTPMGLNAFGLPPKGATAGGSAGGGGSKVGGGDEASVLSPSSTPLSPHSPHTPQSTSSRSSSFDSPGTPNSGFQSPAGIGTPGGGTAASSFAGETRSFNVLARAGTDAHEAVPLEIIYLCKLYLKIYVSMLHYQTSKVNVRAADPSQATSELRDFSSLKKLTLDEALKAISVLVDIFELLFCSDSGGAAATSAYGKQLLETSLVYIFTSMNILISAVNEFQRGSGASGMAMVRSSASEQQRQQQQQQQQYHHHDFTKMAEDTSTAQVRLRIFQFALQALEIELRRCTSASTGRISLGALFKEHLGTVTGGGGPGASSGAGFGPAAARDGADGKSSEHLSVAQISLRLLSASIPGSFAALAQSSVDDWVAELFRKGALTRATAVFDEVAAAVAHVAGVEHNYSGWTCNLAMDQAGDLLAVKPTPGAPGAVATQAGPPGPVISGGGGFGWPVPAAPAAPAAGAGVASAGSSRAELNAVGFLLGVLDIYAKEFVVDRAGSHDNSSKLIEMLRVLNRSQLLHSYQAVLLVQQEQAEATPTLPSRIPALMGYSAITGDVSAVAMLWQRSIEFVASILRSRLLDNGSRASSGAPLHPIVEDICSFLSIYQPLLMLPLNVRRSRQSVRQLQLAQSSVALFAAADKRVPLWRTLLPGVYSSALHFTLLLVGDVAQVLSLVDGDQDAWREYMAEKRYEGFTSVPLFADESKGQDTGAAAAGGAAGGAGGFAAGLGLTGGAGGVKLASSLASSEKAVVQKLVERLKLRVVAVSDTERNGAPVTLSSRRSRKRRPGGSAVSVTSAQLQVFFQRDQHFGKRNEREAKEFEKQKRAAVERLTLLRDLFLAAEEELAGLMAAALCFAGSASFLHEPIEQTKARYGGIEVPPSHFVEGMEVVYYDQGQSQGQFIAGTILEVLKKEPLVRDDKKTAPIYMLRLVNGSDEAEIPISSVLFSQLPMIRFARPSQAASSAADSLGRGIGAIGVAGVGVGVGGGVGGAVGVGGIIGAGAAGGYVGGDFFEGSCCTTWSLMRVLAYCTEAAPLARVAARSSALARSMIAERLEELAGRSVLLLMRCLPQRLEGTHAEDANRQLERMLQCIRPYLSGGGGAAAGAFPSFPPASSAVTPARGDMGSEAEARQLKWPTPIVKRSEHTAVFEDSFLSAAKGTQWAAFAERVFQEVQRARRVWEQKQERLGQSPKALTPTPCSTTQRKKLRDQSARKRVVEPESLD